jgi:hypothetical protein
MKVSLAGRGSLNPKTANLSTRRAQNLRPRPQAAKLATLFATITRLNTEWLHSVETKSASALK